MAQITDAISFEAADLFYSTNGSSWTEVSGETNMVASDGFERTEGELATFDGNGPIVKVGKQGKGTVTFKAAYRENASGLFAVAYDAQANNTDLYFRWIPKGATTTNYRFTTSAGRVKKKPLPTGSASSGDILTVDIQISCGDVTKDAVP